ncbi:MAG: nitronate monooxygenase [Candidatus Nitrosocosmicus sp.]|nr:nitronate monooxygenase [Candidatus Nitrosocosmicus sp.]
MINFHKTSRLCSLLKIKFPIILAGMSGPSTIDLVAAVSNAGGIGILGADAYSSTQLRNGIRKIKSKTSFPFVVNLLLPNIGEIVTDTIVKAF